MPGRRLEARMKKKRKVCGKNKSNRLYVIFAVLLLLAGIGFLFSFLRNQGCRHKKFCDLTFPDGYKIKAELALTETERQRGLMFRKSIGEKDGMFFVFENFGKKYFWMKNTFVDLDIIFLDNDFRIVRIFSNVPRSYEDAPEYNIFRLSANGKYVLEVKAGLAAKHSLKKGDVITIGKCSEKVFRIR